MRVDLAMLYKKSQRIFALTTVFSDVSLNRDNINRIQRFTTQVDLRSGR